jgi:hypothetical protein
MVKIYHNIESKSTIGDLLGIEFIGLIEFVGFVEFFKYRESSHDNSD